MSNIHLSSYALHNIIPFTHPLFRVMLRLAILWCCLIISRTILRPIVRLPLASWLAPPILYNLLQAAVGHVPRARRGRALLIDIDPGLLPLLPLEVLILLISPHVVLYFCVLSVILYSYLLVLALATRSSPLFQPYSFPFLFTLNDPFRYSFPTCVAPFSRCILILFFAIE